MRDVLAKPELGLRQTGGFHRTAELLPGFLALVKLVGIVHAMNLAPFLAQHKRPGKFLCFCSLLGMPGLVPRLARDFEGLGGCAGVPEVGPVP